MLGELGTTFSGRKTGKAQVSSGCFDHSSFQLPVPMVSHTGEQHLHPHLQGLFSSSTLIPQPPDEILRSVPSQGLTLHDTMNMVKTKMRLALDTGSQRVCCRVNRMAPYRLALVGLGV